MVDVKDKDPLDPDELRIVEHRRAGRLEDMDDDCEIMGVSLGLDEACVFSFDKHMAAILGEESAANERLMVEQARPRKDRELDKRYKETPKNRIRYRRA